MVRWFRSLIDRMKALIAGAAAAELEAELLAHAADRRAELLRQAAKSEADGLAAVRPGLKKRADYALPDPPRRRPRRRRHRRLAAGHRRPDGRAGGRDERPQEEVLNHSPDPEEDVIEIPVVALRRVRPAFKRATPRRGTDPPAVLVARGGDGGSTLELHAGDVVLAYATPGAFAADAVVVSASALDDWKDARGPVALVRRGNVVKATWQATAERRRRSTSPATHRRFRLGHRPSRRRRRTSSPRSARRSA